LAGYITLFKSVKENKVQFSLPKMSFSLRIFLLTLTVQCSANAEFRQTDSNKNFHDALNIFMSNGHIWDSTKDKTDDFAESLAKFFDYQGGETQIF